MNRPLLLACLAVPAFFLLGGLVRQGEKKGVVGFSQIGAESSWRNAETDSVKEEAQKRGIDLRFSDAQQKQENQISAVRAFIAQKVDAILLAPVVETGWDDVLKEAKAAHIPVILLDREVTAAPNLYATQIGADLVQEGYRAAKLLFKQMGGKGNVIVLAGTPGSSAATDRQKGFKAALAEAHGIKVIDSEPAGFQRVRGKEVMAWFLKNHPKGVNGILAHNDDMAIGAAQAIVEAGLKPGVDIKIVGIDGIREALQDIVAGTMNGDVECSPLLGKDAFDTVDLVLKGKVVPKKVISHDDEFDISNAGKALPDRKY